MTLPRETANELLASGRGKGVKIAILDSGIEAGHPDLAGLELEDDEVVTEADGELRIEPGEGRDIFGHGTAVCGIIRKLVPNARIGSFRVLGSQLRSRSAIIREGARRALARGYHILNCSFGCSREDHVLYYKDWTDEAYVEGRHIVAACNNQDYARREWPGHFSSVITVNFTRTLQPEAFFYRPGSLVEFLARGEDVDVAWFAGGRKQVSGSSFACAQMSGLLARLLSADPDLSPLEAKVLLKEMAVRWRERAAAETQQEATA